MTSELTFKIVRAGEDIHKERTMKQAKEALELLMLKEHVPTALEAYLSQYPGLKQINMKALVSRVRDLFPKPHQSKASAIVREYLSEHPETYLVDVNVVKVNR